MPDLYTIGYANKNINEFLDLLKINDVNCIIDVRTVPASKQFADFNENNLKRFLKYNDVTYIPFKAEFGARRFEDEVYEKIVMYDDIQVDVVIFNKVYKLDIFQQGVKRVENGIGKGFKICFLCSEKNPTDCHRCIMVAEYFYNLGYEITHIINHEDKISHQEIEKALKENFNSAEIKFKKLHFDEYKTRKYNGGLFGLENSNDEVFDYWSDFFNSYTREKGIYLRNLEIGYKKGNENDD